MAKVNMVRAGVPCAENNTVCMHRVPCLKLPRVRELDVVKEQSDTSTILGQVMMLAAAIPVSASLCMVWGRS